VFILIILVGTFLLRGSTSVKGFPFALTVKSESGFIHQRIKLELKQKNSLETSTLYSVDKLGFRSMEYCIFIFCSVLPEIFKIEFGGKDRKRKFISTNHQNINKMTSNKPEFPK
jgi:hypothetical protein